MFLKTGRLLIAGLVALGGAYTAHKSVATEFVAENALG
jgi:hypothetical protein